MNAALIDELIKICLVLLVVLTVAIISNRSLISLINAYVWHSLTLATIAFLFYFKEMSSVFFFTAILTIISKSILIPILLKQTKKSMNIYTDLEYHYLLPSSSVFFSLLIIISGFFIFSGVKDYFNFTPSSYFGMIIGFSLVMIGFMIIFSRKKIITKIIGYLIMENGVVLLSMFIGELPLLIEVLVLMDLIVLVAITAILGFGMSSSMDDFHKKLHSFSKWFKKVSEK